MISVSNLHKYYGNLHIIRGVTFQVNDGEILSIVGPSGAGKSTLLHIMGTLDPPSSGQVLYDDVNPAELPPRKLAAFRNRHIGFVFQFHHLLPEFTALENVCIPGWIAGKKNEEVERKAYELLDFLQLTHRLQHKPSQLSGGEQQRVAVARALINNPRVVLADEPSGNLDSDSARSLHELFFDLRRHLQQTFVIVTHNEELAQMADRRLLLEDGMLR
ncbi:MAG: ABC transporter ATP-binding protein [Chitinophagales bacterium]|nr:ABC transporter ATP-binding protein [Chitinophagales bacterium]MDW8392699.1 ABC transporter ATP-binding protein [Chitinophagales bacterium]